MLAGGSGQTSERTPDARPKTRFELRNSQLEISDLPIERHEVDLPHRSAFDSVRGVVDDAWNDEVDTTGIAQRSFEAGVECK